MSAENGDFIESIEIETPAGRAWKRVESMRKYLPAMLFQGIAFVSEACNLTSGAAPLQSVAINMGLSGFFVGSAFDMAFYSEIKEKNERFILGAATAVVGGLTTAGLSARYGATAGGLLAFGEGILSMGLTMMYGIMKIQEKVEEIRGGE